MIIIVINAIIIIAMMMLISILTLVDRLNVGGRQVIIGSLHVRISGWWQARIQWSRRIMAGDGSNIVARDVVMRYV